MATSTTGVNTSAISSKDAVKREDDDDDDGKQPSKKATRGARGFGISKKGKCIHCHQVGHHWHSCYDVCAWCGTRGHSATPGLSDATRCHVLEQARPRLYRDCDYGDTVMAQQHATASTGPLARTLYPDYDLGIAEAVAIARSRSFQDENTRFGQQNTSFARENIRLQQENADLRRALNLARQGAGSGFVGRREHMARYMTRGRLAITDGLTRTREWHEPRRRRRRSRSPDLRSSQYGHGPDYDDRHQSRYGPGPGHSYGGGRGRPFF